MSQMVSWKKKGIRAIIEARAKEEEQMAGRGRAHRDYVPDEHEKDYLKKLYDKINNPKKPTEDDLLGPTKPPVDLAGLSDDLKINAAEHKGAQKNTKIYNKGKGTDNPHEADTFLKRTGPQLPKV